MLTKVKRKLFRSVTSVCGLSYMMNRKTQLESSHAPTGRFELTEATQWSVVSTNKKTTKKTKETLFRI
jgi:hypothetical protein